MEEMCVHIYIYIHIYMRACGHVLIYICMYMNFCIPKVFRPFLLENIYIIYCIYNIYLRVCKFEYNHFINNTFSKITLNFCFFVLWLVGITRFCS